MLKSYRRIFSAPGAVGFTVTGFLGRLPISMFGVSVVIMVATRRDSYALAGAVSAAGLAAVAVATPWIGRLVDRYGQARVTVPATLISVTASTLLILCARWNAPDWTLFVAYIASSGVPSIGVMARARWAELYRDQAELLHSANSFEQALDELCFMLGPVLATLLCTLLFPEAGLAVAALLLLTGSLLFTAQRRTEPSVHPAVAANGSPLGIKGIKEITATFLFTGVIFGSMEIVTVAYAEEAGNAAAAGVILALLAGGSAIAGLVFGALKVRGPAPVRFLVCVAAMALLMQPILLADNIWALAMLLFVAGAATAPTMITSMTLVNELAPPSRINESMTLTITGMLIGISAGAAIGGWAVEQAGARSGYAVPAVASVIALATALIGFAPAALRSRRQSRGLASLSTKVNEGAINER
ncbi:MFS transporter [Salinispora oceanensis]|uniref:MFS transporter n=1 Tax=Salinispora oceanensis TaxID=1050199 RepID=UPI001CC616A5|nr:MFS transporter [Salinispora oceanensis]